MVDTVQELAKVIQTLVQTKSILSDEKGSGEGEEKLDFDIKDVQTAQDRDLADPFFQLETDPEILRLFRQGQK